ncbi:MAG: hypothetical protein IJ851_05715 [Eubacterium sp.]|nr:hypothetical protein [Eubacterium sp.]
MKKAVKLFLLVLISIVLTAGIAVGAFFLFYTPSLTADFSQKNGEVSSRASGYLYGLAQPGVPSENMVESLDISTVAQKVPGGLQHPIGDMDNVYPLLENTDYDVVYLQDAYSTWYYDHENIEKMRKDGTYDWKKYLEYDYLPKVKSSVESLKSAPYSDKLVYCIYNECDNGLWFGETVEDDSELGFWCAYNEVGSANFFDAWKITYDYVKSLNPDALIGGPGFYEYNSDKMAQFMSFCADNDCIPDVIIYHELNDYSIYFWQQHVRDYRQMEKELVSKELPIIVTEYGRMCDTGLPGKMVQYITQIETSGVYGDVAYWRLANNLCDTAADDNMPNANWWLYRWYADMEGSLISSQYRDLFNSNFENAYIKRKAEYTSQGFMGIVSMTESEDRIDIICGGGEGDVTVKLKNLDETSLCKENVVIRVEEVLYKGLEGAVTAPLCRSLEYKTLCKSESIKINDTEKGNAYHIVIEKTGLTGENFDYNNNGYVKRYEFENGELLKNAYTYDSAYATTGEINGMVGGMENEGDGVRFTFEVPDDDTYNIDIVYGNANDGAFDENGRQNSDDRTTAYTVMTLDGEKTTIGLDSTIKSEFTNCYTLESLELSKGEHTISFEHSEGTYVLDSMIVSTGECCDKFSYMYDDDRSSEGNYAYLAVVENDGYYNIYSETVNFNSVILNGYKIDGVTDNDYYLRRGVNYIEFECDEKPLDLFFSQSDNEKLNTIKLLDPTLSGGAITKFSTALDGYYIDGISSDGGSAQYTINADEQGVYAFTVCYSNNEEGGYHDYNVDLIERYVTVDFNGESTEVFCRNTYDWDKYKTVTFYARLNSGENTVTLYNDGAYKFNNQTAYAPHISSVYVSDAAL